MTAEEDKQFCEWMRRAQAGDEASYRTLLIELSKFLEIYFTRRLFDSSMVSDLVQESLISIHKSRHTFSQDANFSPWFYAIAHNRFVDFIRKNKKIGIQVQWEGTENDGEGELEDWCGSQGVHFDLEETLKLLSEKERDVLLLVKVEGLSIKETAQRTGLSEANIKVIVHRSIKKMKERVNRMRYEKD